ncbi:MAG: pyridoxamine 5'-phosphate oxidase [Rhodobacterales bacterium]|nr:MAG: pyridoxamine 5'-phosphate oxidase [Rhodobacterales bacterium]
MQFLENLSELEDIYSPPAQASLLKVAQRMTPAYRTWIGHSRFCVVSTVGPDGVDGSPRGDQGPVVLELDPQTLALPDWRGNNRIDSLRNLIADPRIALMFMVPGSNNVVRVNGRGRITTDADLRARFEINGHQPKVVIVIDIAEIYIQCARAVMRSGLWTAGDYADGLPSPGDILSERSSGEFDGKSYDQNWPKRAKETMW